MVFNRAARLSMSWLSFSLVIFAYAKITTEKLDKDFSVLESKIGDKMKLV